MTIMEVNVTVAMSNMAAIGDIKRFSSPQKLVSCFGLNPKVRQSGDKPAYHGRISKQGRAHARSILVEAAWMISGVPGPLRAFFVRIRNKRGKSVAAVATARKLAVIVWHMLSKDEVYTWSGLALLQWKLRYLELAAGHASRRWSRQKGPAAVYSKKAVATARRRLLRLRRSLQLTRSMLASLHQVNGYSCLSERLAGFEAMQPLHQDKTFAVRSYKDRHLLPFCQHALGKGFDLL